MQLTTSYSLVPTLRKPRIPMPILGILVMMALCFYSTGFQIGPVSVKVYVAVALFSFMALFALMKKTGVIQLSWGKKVLLLWVALIIWKIIAKTANGFGATNAVIGILKNDIIAMFTFLAIIYFVRTRKDLEFVISFLIFLTILSVIVSIMQWLDFGRAWRLQQILNPGIEKNFMEINQGELIPGLAESPVAFGYYLAVVFPFMAPQMLESNQRFIKITNVTLLLMGIFLLQQRSVLLIALVSSVLIIYGAHRYLKRQFHTLLLVGFILVGGSYIVFQLADVILSEYGRYSMYRISQFTDTNRIELAKIAIKTVMEHPFFGVPRMMAMGENGLMSYTSPHNLLLNTLLYYGIFGVILVCTMLVSFYRKCLAIWRNSWLEGDFVSIGLVLGLGGHILNSMFHNASFVTGDFLFWWIVAFIVVSEQIKAKEKLGI